LLLKLAILPVEVLRIALKLGSVVKWLDGSARANLASSIHQPQA
jgi:hypothetical protein